MMIEEIAKMMSKNIDIILEEIRANQKELKNIDAAQVFGISHDQLQKMGYKELRKLYRQKAQELHPDKTGDDEMFKKLQTAWRIVQHPEDKATNIMIHSHPEIDIDNIIDQMADKWHKPSYERGPESAKKHRLQNSIKQSIEFLKNDAERYGLNTETEIKHFIARGEGNLDYELIIREIEITEYNELVIRWLKNQVKPGQFIENTIIRQLINDLTNK